MADRVSATIMIGGTLPAALLDAFIAEIEAEALAPEWDGAPFTLADLPTDGPLRLMASEVAWGQFEELEAFCRTHGLPFVRWHQSSSGSWGGGRVVFTGSGDVTDYTATDDDTAMIDRETVIRLGSLAAVLAYFDAADFTPPPLRIAR